jgi:hypothetical protein
MADQQRRDDRNAETTRPNDDTTGGQGRKDEADAPSVADVPDEGDLARRRSARRKPAERGVQKIDLSSGSE